MIKFIQKVLNLLKQYSIKKLYTVLILSLVISIIELLGVSLIMPFIAIASDFSSISENKYLSIIYDSFQFNSNILFVVTIGVLLVFFYLFRMIINILFANKISNFSYKFYEYIVSTLYKRYIYISYKNFMKENSASYTKAIINEAQSFTFVIIAFLQMVSEFFVIFFIYTFLLYVNFEATLYISIVMTLLILIIMKPISKKIKNVGIEREIGQKQVYESLHSTFGNYKILKLHGSKKFNINNFEQSIKKLVSSNIIFQTISPVPKLLLEFLGFSVILIVISFYVYTQEKNIQNILPLISVYILAMYRLLPSVSRIVTGYNSLLFAHKSFEIISEHLLYKIEKLGKDKINFKNSISINKGVFYYEKKEKVVINNISLIIKKGESIAFIGSSGSGKSTLVDIIMGLQILNSGTLKIDDTRINENNIQFYRSKIGYIPQQVYLFDGTVKDNIIFGEKYDEKRLVSVLKQAQIYDFLLQKDGVNTLVGEGGNLLSGGQKQRMAIARALYTNPEILVLDEATSALDNDTETKIMDEIYNISKDKTLIVIAHRLSTIEKCNRVYEIKNGKLENVR